jgi:hypothetical protein
LKLNGAIMGALTFFAAERAAVFAPKDSRQKVPHLPCPRSGRRKRRRLALAEFALGIESLERFIRREPFHRPHECVFAVLALKNKAADSLL